MARGVSAKAQAAENSAFSKLDKKLGGEAIVSPAGFDAGFPDFGFRVHLANGAAIDLHVEYKASYKAQMGSMRDWKYDGRKFFTPDTDSASKEQLIEVMNDTQEAKRNADRLMKDLQTYFHPDVKEISSSTMNIVSDKKERHIKAEAFAKGTDNYQVAKIKNTQMGDMIIRHYNKKFKQNLKPGSIGSILFMMLKDKIWVVDTYGRVDRDAMDQVAQMFGHDKLDKLRGLTAQLEVRIQPRGLNSPGKRKSIDVMASFRLAAAPSGGQKVI